jgi:hypothetical protein
MHKGVLALVACFLVVAAGFTAYLATTPRAGCYMEGTRAPSRVWFTFSIEKALQFYLSLKTPLGLEREYPQSTTVWLADDQALDYYALQKIYNVTGNSTALAASDEINGSARGWGGLYAYWNPAFEAFGCYPTDADVLWGRDVTVNKSVQGFAVKATEFSWDPVYPYPLFADQLAYRTLLYLHLGDYRAAEGEFALLSGMWAVSGGQGFADLALWQQGGLYQSYKLALYVIAWNQLEDNPATQSFASGYASIVGGVLQLMANLQSSGGGVWTGYRFSDGKMVYGDNVTAANGETTSLFILADGWPNLND